MSLVNALSIILSITGLVSCASSKQLDTRLELDFNQIADIIKSHCKDGKYVPFNNYSVTLVEKFKTGSQIGVCFIYPGTNRRVIQIRRDYWEYSNDTDRLAVMAHEMIHCFLNMDGHIEDPPGHIMNSTLAYFESYGQLIDHVNDVIYNRCNK